jgi:phosphatidylglycerol:prolipoprotein diacylglycerol transferase
MFPTISLGPLVLPSAGIIYILGAWVVLSVIERAAKALDLDAEHTYGLAAISLVAGFAGARLVFVVLHWPAYQENLTSIIWPLTSGYEVWGGLFFALVAAFFYGRARRLPFAATLDALAPGFLAGFIVVSLADFAAGPGYGTETNVFWALDIFGINRHAVQIYEIIIALIAFIVWWQALKRRQFEGQLFLLAMATYAAGRLFVDAYRANSPLTAGGYHFVQIISLVILLICLIVLARMVTRGEQDGDQAKEQPQS